jgi:hypothetical protein
VLPGVTALPVFAVPLGWPRISPQEIMGDPVRRTSDAEFDL